jgi:hypothetical protein
MTPRIQRLSVALILPPLLGGTAFFSLEVFVDRLWGRSFADHVGSLFTYLAYGVIFCILPGAALWGILEVMRAQRPSLFASGKHLLVCAVLGALTGCAFAVLLSRGGDLAAFLYLVPLGLVVAVFTGWIMSRCRLPGT